LSIKKAALKKKTAFKYKLILQQAKSAGDDVDLFFVVPSVAEGDNAVNKCKYGMIPA